MMKCKLILSLLIGTCLFAQTIGNPYNATSIAQTVLNVQPIPKSGEVVGWDLTYSSTGACWVQFFNAAAANVSLGSTAPFFSILVLPSGTNVLYGGMRIPFSTAISIASANTATGSTACTGNPSGVVFYH